MENSNRVHFIGIGGIGVSALARHYSHEGWQVSGSDIARTINTEKLEALSIDVRYEQVPENITDDIDLVVYTEAMAADHPELVAARERGIETINYFEALGRVVNGYHLIAVAGTHGKTTTTAMVADILEEASYDPTVIVGSLRSKTGSNYRPGESKYAVVEACEYKRDFLHLEPDVLVITNLELEHVDYYKDIADVQAAFRSLAEKVPEDGVVVADTSDENVQPILEGLECRVVDYREYIDLQLSMTQPGMHNRLNAAAAAAASATLEIDQTVVDQALGNFAGTWRRFEYKGDVSGAKVYDDYAHHPTEIRAAIAGARELYPDRTLTVLFQSHTFSRTKALFDDFVTELAKADRVLMIPIYAAREEDTGEVSSEMIVDALQEQGVMAEHFHTLEAAVLRTKETVGSGDVVMTLGAGEITRAGDLLVA